MAYNSEHRPCVTCTHALKLHRRVGHGELECDICKCTRFIWLEGIDEHA